MKIQLTDNKEIYNYCKPYIIAEIGSNHNGDIELAKAMIDEAIKCGCDCVKFQSWDTNSLISEPEYKANTTYADSKKKHFGSLREMVEKYYLRKDQHYELRDYCIKKGIDFNSTPFSNEEVDLLNDLNVPFYKIASMDINNIPLLKYIAKFNKPIVLSTGMASLGEIENAINTIEKENNFKIILLHCISIYPPLNEQINLNNILMLQNTFTYPVGFSDHSIGFSIPLASIALGACIIEKHFTIDKNLPGWDHEISADPTEMEIIVKESKNISESLGSFKRIISEDEEEKKKKFRRSIILKNNLQKGHIITEEDLVFKRPGTGFIPNEAQYIIGKKLRKNLASEHILKKEDFD
ncbi:MAG: N-acetylneuraminate synthase family protein [Arcobacter sp.]|uniref:N-acetylneuraminate synthase family protein n=1 Tax=Arcobacter sp. TaxID=1872629 RepID=UPI003B00D2CF